ncbi:MAG: ACP S-malonyltransferase [Planctomycetia bacterium]
MAIVFPGQGAQAVGMAGEWCDTTPAARRLFDRAAEVLGYDLLAICRSGPVEKLGSTAVSQPAILVTSLAALEVLRSRDGNPLASATVTAGLSLGEYTALVFAGAIEFDDAVRLVDLRGRAMQDCADSRPGAMVAVLGVERAALAELCAGCREADVLEVANVLCPGNIVVSGTATACRRLEAAALAAGALKCVPLDVAGAFHTALMQPAVERLAAALAQTPVRPPRIPVVSNVDARPHDDPDEIRRLLARQVSGVVEWQASVAAMLAMGVNTIWEVGPGRVLRGLMTRIDRSVACHGVFD